MGILVKILHVGVGRGGVEVIVEFLAVFTVVSLMTGDTEKTFLEDMVLTVPDRKREAKTLVVV